MKAGTTQAEIEYRVAIIATLVLRGKSRFDIVQFGTKKWKIKDRQVDEYIKKAKDKIEEESQSTIASDIATARARLQMLFDKAVGNEDWGLARVINKDFIEFTGVKGNTESSDLNNEYIVEFPEFEDGDIEN